MARTRQRALKGILPSRAEQRETRQILSGAAARAMHIVDAAKANRVFAGRYAREVERAERFLLSHARKTSTADQATTFLKAVASIRIRRKK